MKTIKALFSLSVCAICLCIYAWFCLVVVNAQLILKQRGARSLSEAVAVAARMPIF